MYGIIRSKTEVKIGKLEAIRVVIKVSLFFVRVSAINLSLLLRKKIK